MNKSVDLLESHGAFTKASTPALHSCHIFSSAVGLRAAPTLPLLQITFGA
jgi:hypothetical protein